MSTSSLYTTFCDSGVAEQVPEKPDTCRWWTAEADTRAESRKVARRLGWAVGAKGLPDFCPECAPKDWCPTCGVSGDGECATSTGRNHPARNTLISERFRRSQRSLP